MTNIDLGK